MEPKSNLKLFGTWVSPFVQRVQLALKLKGLEYEYVEEDLANKSPELLRHNPIYKKVPVLVHGDRSVCESFIILEYVDEAWKDGYPLFPEDPHERAAIRFWHHFHTDKMVPAMCKVLRTTGEEQKAAVQEFRQTIKHLEDEMREGIFKSRRFLGGVQPGVLDILFVCGSVWIPLLDEMVGVKLIDPENFPHLWAWFLDINDHEVVKEVIPHKESQKELAKAFVAKISAAPRAAKG